MTTQNKRKIMSQISQASSSKFVLISGGRVPDNTSGGDGGNIDLMEARVLKLEDFAQDTRDRLTRIETRLDNTATKADVAELRAEIADTKADLVKWIVGTAIGLGVAGITVMTFVLNNATPKNPVAPTQPPIIINIPSQAPVK